MSRTVISHPDGTQTTVVTRSGCGQGCSWAFWLLIGLFVIDYPAQSGWPVVGIVGSTSSAIAARRPAKRPGGPPSIPHGGLANPGQPLAGASGSVTTRRRARGQGKHPLSGGTSISQETTGTIEQEVNQLGVGTLAPRDAIDGVLQVETDGSEHGTLQTVARLDEKTLALG